MTPRTPAEDQSGQRRVNQSIRRVVEHAAVELTAAREVVEAAKAYMAAPSEELAEALNAALAHYDDVTDGRSASSPPASTPPRPRGTP